MQQALGDRLFDLAIEVFFLSWAAGWVVLLVVMALQYVLPAREAALERILQRFGRVLAPALKYTGLAALTLFALRLVATWLGWAGPARPFSVGDPGVYDPRR